MTSVNTGNSEPHLHFQICNPIRSLPYGKFVHATYRTSALTQDSLEDRNG